MNTKSSKTNESTKFTDKLNLINSNKKIALGNLNIYYTWNNISFTYNNNKFNIYSPTLNGDFDFPD